MEAENRNLPETVADSQYSLESSQVDAEVTVDAEATADTVTSTDTSTASTVSTQSSFNVTHWSLSLRCNVCWEYFREPRSLPCGHSFCKRCLQTIVQDARSSHPRTDRRRLWFSCPVCRYRVKVFIYQRHCPRNISLETAVREWLASRQAENNQQQNEAPEQTDETEYQADSHVTEENIPASSYASISETTSADSQNGLMATSEETNQQTATPVSRSASSYESNNENNRETEQLDSTPGSSAEDGTTAQQVVATSGDNPREQDLSSTPVTVNVHRTSSQASDTPRTITLHIDIQL